MHEERVQMQYGQHCDCGDCSTLNLTTRTHNAVASLLAAILYGHLANEDTGLKEQSIGNE
jgi:hypothetical protein